MSPSVSDERRLGAMIDEHVHRGVHTKIRLNKSTGIFGAFLGDAEMTAASLRELKTILEKKIDEGLNLTWQPIIHITVNPPKSDEDEREAAALRTEVKLQAERFYVARVQGPNWRRLAWDALQPGSSIERQLRDSKAWQPPIVDQSEYHHDAGRQRAADARKLAARENWAPPFYEDWKGARYEVEAWLTYTPELWRALEEIGQLLRNARTQLAHMTATKKGVAQIAIAGANLPKLLGAGQ